MANPGIPTRKSHDRALTALMDEADSVFIIMEELSSAVRAEMIAGAVGDDRISHLWQSFAEWKSRLNEFRRAPDFHDAYARYRGLAYTFDCTDNVNAATDKITGLPDFHRFKVDHRIEFRIIEGVLPTNLSEGTAYWGRNPGQNDVELFSAEGGGTIINLTNAVGRAEMLVNIRPDYGSLRTAVDAVLTEVETNLTQRAPTYDQANADFTYSTRSSIETANLQSDLADVVALIDVIAA